jgi:mannose-6-phosphate isomerase
MFELYPMKFRPILKEKIWGGTKIKEMFGISEPGLEKCGELWALSAVEGSESVLINGHFEENTLAEMSEIFMDDFLGEAIYEKYKHEFPLLVKIIDANDYLSVQVHPDDAMAKTKHGLHFGKSEMWYVLHADEGAHIVAGFNQPMNKEKLLKHIEQGTLKETLNYEPMQTGNMIYLPAGLIHAVGPGLVIAEIQQTSDVTYRLYDWDRFDDEGKPRELHINDASEAIDYELKPSVIRDFCPTENATVEMIKTPYFTTSFIQLETNVEKNLEIIDKFVLYFCISGKCIMIYETEKIEVTAGECILVPAYIDKVFLIPTPSAKLIEIIPE